jgi:hypothetical protein
MHGNLTQLGIFAKGDTMGVLDIKKSTQNSLIASINHAGRKEDA